MDILTGTLWCIFFIAQVTWIDFKSTTTDSEQTLRQFGSGGTFFKLAIRFGRDISPLSLFPDENELLLLPNSVFKVKTALSSGEVSEASLPAHIFSAAWGGWRHAPRDREARRAAERPSALSSLSLSLGDAFEIRNRPIAAGPPPPLARGLSREAAFPATRPAVI